MEEKILALLPCMAHELEEAFPSKKGDGLSLRLAAQAPNQPFYLCSLPAAVFAAVVALCEAGKASFVTVSAREAKLCTIGVKLSFPLVSVDVKAGQTYTLPMRLEPGIVPGGGRFFNVGDAATTFRCAAGALRDAMAAWPTSDSHAPLARSLPICPGGMMRRRGPSPPQPSPPRPSPPRPSPPRPKRRPQQSPRPLLQSPRPLLQTPRPQKSPQPPQRL